MKRRIVNNTEKLAFRKFLRKTQTPQEAILWSRLRNNQTGYKWRRQVSIGPYVADFYCREKLLVIEVDGSQHLGDIEYDNKRDKYFEQIGICTLRFWNNEINTNMIGVMLKIENTLYARPHPNPLLKGEGV